MIGESSRVVVKKLKCARHFWLGMGRADYFSARAGHGPAFSGPGGPRVSVFQPRACSGHQFWPIFSQFSPIFRLRAQIMRFGLGRATQNSARVGPGQQKNMARGPNFGPGRGPTHPYATYSRVMLKLVTFNQNTTHLSSF